MNLTESLLLEDVKIGLKRVIDPNNESNNSFELLMHSFVYFLNPLNDCEPDYENREFAKTIYSELGWDDVNDSYDVINSFWITFSWLMHVTFPEKYPVAKAGNVKIYKRHNYGYESYPEKYIAKTTTLSTDLLSSSKLLEFSSLCHCIANFMPCPDSNFNMTKGYLDDVNDYLPLMIDKLQECVDTGNNLKYELYNQNKSIFNATINNWHNWFVKNREKYSMEPYYYVKKENNEMRIIGIPFFKNQSLKNPAPKSRDEVDECIDEILKRIMCRARLILRKYQNLKKTVD